MGGVPLISAPAAVADVPVAEGSVPKSCESVPEDRAPVVEPVTAEAVAEDEAVWKNESSEPSSCRLDKALVRLVPDVPDEAKREE